MTGPCLCGDPECGQCFPQTMRQKDAKVVLQEQPTKTSCGPTCVAMLAGVPVADVLRKVKAVRSQARRKKTNHGTNVAEIIRLLQPYGMTLGRRLRGERTPRTGQFLLRIEKRAGRRWHWAVLSDGWVYDPIMDTPIPADLMDVPAAWLSWYEAERVK